MHADPEAERDHTTGRAGARWLLPVLCVAAAARVLHLLTVQGDPLYAVPLGDEALYVDWARRIAEDGWTAGDGTSQGLYHAPGYAWFLACLAALGIEGAARLWVQALLGVMAALFVASAARRLTGERRVGIVAGIAYALFPPALFYEATLHKVALAQFLVGAALWALARAREGGPRPFVPAFVFGLAVGLGALTQEILLVLLPFALALRSGGALVARLAPAAVALLGCGLGAAPLVARNVAVDAPALARTTNVGPNLWIGSGEGATGRYRPLVAGRGQVATEEADARRIAEDATARTMEPAEISDWWRDRALADMAAAPLATARLWALKFARVFSAEEWSDSRAYRAHRERSWVLGLLGVPLQMATVTAFALAGALRALRRRSLLVPTLGTALAYASALSFFFVFGRLRFALVPLLLPLAAYAGVALFEALRARRRPGAWALGLLVLPLLLVPNEDDAAPAATTYSNAAAAHLAAGRADRARALVDASLAAAPDNANIVFHHGDLMARMGDEAAARPSLMRAAELWGAYGFRAHLTLAELAAARGDTAGVKRELQRASGYRTELATELRRAAWLCREAGAPRAAEIFEARIGEL